MAERRVNKTKNVRRFLLPHHMYSTVQCKESYAFADGHRSHPSHTHAHTHTHTHTHTHAHTRTHTHTYAHAYTHAHTHTHTHAHTHTHTYAHTLPPFMKG